MSELVTWIDVDGIPHPFDGEAGSLIYPIWGRQGALAPAYSEVEQQVYGIPGSWLRNIVVAPRDVSLPVVVKGLSATDFRSRLRQLRYWTDPRRGNGILRVQGPDGNSRDLVCHKISGDTGDESSDNSGVAHIYETLVFHANDPYWYDTDYTLRSFSTSAAVPFFQTPFFPLHLSAAGILSDFTLSNMGDVECWPVWQLYGPGVNPAMTNNTTGATLDLTISLGSGDVLTIDTAEFVKTVTLQDGSNQYNALSLASWLWPLVVGDNSISISMSGTDSTSRVVVKYKQRYNML